MSPQDEIAKVAVADNVLERKTPGPDMGPSSCVSFQLIGLTEVVPGSKDLNSARSNRTLTKTGMSYAVYISNEVG
jgi:hypothetical protein